MARMRSWFAGSSRLTSLPSAFQKASSLSAAAAIAVGQRRQDAVAALEQVEQRRLGAGILRAGDRMGRNEMHAGRDVRRHVGDHGLLDRADVGHDAAGLERRRDRLGGRTAGADRRADDHQVGVLGRGGEIGAAMIDQLQPVGRGRRLRAARRRDDRPGEPALARFERDRAADQADADQRDFLEHWLGHFCAATKRCSESRTAFTSASVPMVMRRCSGMP